VAGKQSMTGAVATGATEGIVDSVASIPQMLWSIGSLIRSAQSPLEVYKYLGSPVKTYREFVAAYGAATPEQKHQFLTAAGELVGGAAGAAAGSGVASIPGAGAGAVLGRLGAEELGKLMGLPGAPKMEPEEQARVLARTFTGNAAGEGLGAAAARTNRAVPALRNLVKKPFTPSAEQVAVNAKADRFKIPMTIGQRSGRKAAQAAETVIDFTPTGSGVLRKGRERAQKGFEDAITREKSALYKDEITPEEFTQVNAKNSLGAQRGDLDTRTAQVRGQAESAIYPRPQTPYQGGSAMIEGNKAAKGRLRARADEAYGGFTADLGDTPVDLTDFGERARAIIEDELPEGARSFFPSGTNRQLEQAGAMKPAFSRELTEQLMATGKALGAESVEEFQQKAPGLFDSLKKSFAEAGFSDTMVPPQMTLTQAMKLRSRLLEMGRSVGPTTPGVSRRAIGRLRQELDAAIDQSLPPDARQRFRDINQTYRDDISLVDSDAGQVIQSAKFPEDLVNGGGIVQPGASSRIGEAFDSTRVSGEPRDAGAVGSFRRANLDKTVSESTEGRRFSPRQFGRQLERLTPETVDSLYGETAPAVQRMADPALVADEARVYDSPLSKDIDAGITAGTWNKVFPKRNPQAVEEALAFFGRTGDDAPMRRAAVEDLTERSMATDRNLDASKKVVDAFKLDDNLARYGGSVDAAAGPDVADNLRDITQVGRALGAPVRNFGNPSGTARASHLLQKYGAAGTALASPSAIPGIAVGATVPWLAGKVATNDRAVKFLTSAPEKMPAALPDKGLRLGMRVPFVAPKPVEDKEVDWFKENGIVDEQDDWFKQNGLQ
jgi:hypothetical protein